MEHKKINQVIIGLALLLFVFNSCKESEPTPMGTISFGITDTRSTSQKTGGIIDATKLGKFEITISKIELKTSSGAAITVLDKETKVDLRSYQGIVKNLVTQSIPLGKYTGLIFHVSGISMRYDGNSYCSSVSGATTLSLAGLPGVTYTPANGIPNIFEHELTFELAFDFELTQKQSDRTVNINIDAVASCYEISFTCPVCTQTMQRFVCLRPFFQMNVYFNEGIQQIKHSPPLGIRLAGGTTAEYYGIHTFMDFNQQGGTINSHTSQHVYRGEDGALLIDAENMVQNNTALTPNTVNATGKTDVKAYEVFNFSAIGSNLAAKGYTLASGKTYYFSLRKTWNITSGSTIYEITRICEPIPVYWP